MLVTFGDVLEIDFEAEHRLRTIHCEYRCNTSRFENDTVTLDDILEVDCEAEDCMRSIHCWQ